MNRGNRQDAASALVSHEAIPVGRLALDSHLVPAFRMADILIETS